MTIDEIKELIHVVHETGIAELEVQRGDNRVRIRKSVGTAGEIMLAAQPLISAGGPAAGLAGAPSIAPPAPVQTQEDERDTVVKSPIVGTYYDSPAPGSGPFVKVGDRVEPKQVLCIIESMKLMNEIEADIAGTLIAKHVENGRPVEYGESLFTIRPL